MASRADATPKNTSGKYVLNRSLSTPHDDVLAAQGVSWLHRTAIAIATVTLEIKHTYTTDPQLETISFQHIATGGIKGTSGAYHFPAERLPHSDHVFGPVLISAKRKPLSEVSHPFLTQNWLSDIENTPFPDQKGVLWTSTVPDRSKRPDAPEWAAEQVWGYALHEIPGYGRQKRYTRKLHFVSPTMTKDILLVYDQRDGDNAATTISSERDEELASFGGS